MAAHAPLTKQETSAETKKTEALLPAAKPKAKAKVKTKIRAEPKKAKASALQTKETQPDDDLGGHSDSSQTL